MPDHAPSTRSRPTARSGPGTPNPTCRSRAPCGWPQPRRPSPRPDSCAPARALPGSRKTSAPAASARPGSARYPPAGARCCSARYRGPRPRCGSSRPAAGHRPAPPLPSSAWSARQWAAPPTNSCHTGSCRCADPPPAPRWNAAPADPGYGSGQQPRPANHRRWSAVRMHGAQSSRCLPATPCAHRPRHSPCPAAAGARRRTGAVPGPPLPWQIRHAFAALQHHAPSRSEHRSSWLHAPD